MALLVASGVGEGVTLGAGVGEGVGVGSTEGAGVGEGAGVAAAGALAGAEAGAVEVNELLCEKAVQEKTISLGAALFSLIVKPPPDRPWTTNLTSQSMLPEDV